MCMVSVVLGYGQQVPFWQYDPARFNTLLDVAEKAKQYDAENGEPHCEDPSKAEWLRAVLDQLARIDQRLTAIEAAQAAQRVVQLLEVPQRLGEHD